MPFMGLILSSFGEKGGLGLRLCLVSCMSCFLYVLRGFYYNECQRSWVKKKELMEVVNYVNLLPLGFTLVISYVSVVHMFI